MAVLTAVISVASLAMAAGPASARGFRYVGAAPGQVTCHLSGAITFSPRITASGGGTRPSTVKGRLSGCTTTSSSVKITSGKVTGTLASSPLRCATLSSTGAPATLTMSWRGSLYGRRATFTPTTLTASGSQLVTGSNGTNGFAIPGAAQASTASGSFPKAAAGSTAKAFTAYTPSALSSMCKSRQGIRKLMVAGTVTAGSPASPAVAQGVPLGDYAGYVNPGGIAAFGSATGTHLTFATDYLEKSSGWGPMDSLDMSGWSHSPYRLVLGVPILPGTGTLAQGATGAYDQYFTTLARNLVNEGEANAILRLGWEFNGNWFRWSVGTAGDAANFASFWRQIVTTMRAVPGEKFKFLWNPNAPSPTSYTPAQAYPGDAYVDYVGTDVYDNYWGSPFTPSAAWANQLSEQWGLNWLASFASAHHKAIAIPEWSGEYRDDGHGLGDDPSFIDHMAAWFVAHNVAFADIWSYDSSGTYRNNILDGTFPNALARFRLDFG